MINPTNLTSTAKLNTPSLSRPGGAFGATDFGKSFASFLDNAMTKLNVQNQAVEQLGDQFMVGKLEDVHKLTIANEKALLGLELTVQVRNKAVEAYQEIMRMQI